jgi:hypothetical protein
MLTSQTIFVFRILVRVHGITCAASLENAVESKYLGEQSRALLNARTAGKLSSLVELSCHHLLDVVYARPKRMCYVFENLHIRSVEISRACSLASASQHASKSAIVQRAMHQR